MKKNDYLISYIPEKGYGEKEITLRFSNVSKKYIDGYVDGLKSALPFGTQVYCEIIPN